MRILYLFAGTRKKLGRIGIDSPDTPLYGLNHLKRMGFQVDYKEFSDVFGPFLEKILSFRIRHLLMFFAVKNYDIVFGPSLIYLMPLKIIFRNKAKFVLLNIYLNRLLGSNKGKFFKFRLIKFLINKMDGIVCLSNIQKEYLINNYDFPEERIFFTLLGVDINFHKYVPDEKREDFILSAGSDDGRDYKKVLKIAGFYPNLKFIIICGQKNMAGIKKRDIPDNVEIMYYIPFKKLRPFYQKAKISLIVTYPDSHIQGADCSGQTVLLDSMASGLPVITNKKEYMSDYVENNKEIIIIDSNSVKRFKEKIDLLLSNKDLRNRMAERARQKTEESFNTKIMAKNLAYFFKEIINN